MCIKDLIKVLYSDFKLRSIGEFKGHRIAIDTRFWLQKAISTSIEEFVDSGLDQLFYVDFMMARARNFRIAGIEPVFVFEGRPSAFKVTYSYNNFIIILILNSNYISRSIQ